MSVDVLNLSGRWRGVVAGVFAVLLSDPALAEPPARDIEVPVAENDASATPDWVGDLATAGDVELHARKATEWLRKHPRHDYAVHVAERLYLLARAQDDFRGSIPCGNCSSSITRSRFSRSSSHGISVRR